ncbi:hypothetical protein SAY87_026553 [Trapa incisa]|uniref:glucan endo-1,3-beta-D-glucosidase n=1 Tax=Trapa incisa TaxID=236973 RepID=A0AAN7GUP9_9MYRT|nr:hypothetical protein SAY87_026553 [Trapa incisa]
MSLSRVVKKVERKIRRSLKKKRTTPPPSMPTGPLGPPAPLPPTVVPPLPPPPNFPFLFPTAQSSILPDPSLFFSPSLLSTPLPTNSFFQNFTLKDGNVPEYIHPYLIKLGLSCLSLCFPSSRFSTPAFVYQVFNADLTISTESLDHGMTSGRHIISYFDDLSITLDFPSSNLRFFLVRGSPFLTFSVLKGTPIVFTTIHAVLSLYSDKSHTKHTIKLNNDQTWVIYTSSPINLAHDISTITSDTFSGIVRVAIMPSPDYEPILDRFSSSYAVSGEASLSRPFFLEYKWHKRGWGNLLMLAHSLHLRLLSPNDCEVEVLEGFRYNSIDGDLVGIVGDSWALKPDPVSITWHSIRSIREESYGEIISALRRDVEGLSPAGIATSSSYFYGKLIARAARLALIAEDVGLFEVIPKVRQYLKETIEPWLDGTFEGNGFLYDKKWGGIVSKQGSLDSTADFGFGLYNDHHYHLGYFIYAIAVLAKIDSGWGRKYRPQAYSLMADFMNLGRRSNSSYPRLRCFDLYKLHSWAGGLTEFADGRNQESTSEAVNAYYSATLMGLAYGDAHLVAMGSMLTSFEIHAAHNWWHVRRGDSLYDEDFTRENRMVGVLWANKRDSGLWFAPSEWRECRLGIQLLPLLPISEILFSDVEFARELVDWANPALERDGVGEGWKGFVYALQGIYDKEGALEKIKSLKGHDDGNSLSNLLWWIHSRVDEEDMGCKGGGNFSWFGHYCH